MSSEWELEKAGKDDESHPAVSLGDLAELSGEGLALVDPVNGFTVVSNGTFRQLFGLVPGEEACFADLFTQEWAREGWQRILADGPPKTWRPVRTYFKGAEGRLFSAELRVAWVERAGGVILGLSVRDTSDEVRMAQAVARGTRLRRLGSLAGSLVHRFNNLLQSMIGTALSIEDPTAREALETVEKYGRRATDLSAALLRVLSPEENSRPEIIAVDREIKDLVELLEKMAQKRKCTIQSDLDEEVRVHARGNLLRDLLLDLTHQHLAATPAEGVLLLSLQRREAPSHQRWHRGQAVLEWRITGAVETPFHLAFPRMSEFAATVLGGNLTPPGEEGGGAVLTLPLVRR